MTDDARTAMMEVWLAEPCPHYDGPHCPDARGGFLASGVQLCDACLADLFASLREAARDIERSAADNARLRARVAELEAARTRAVAAELPPTEWDND